MYTVRIYKISKTKQVY